MQSEQPRSEWRKFIAIDGATCRALHRRPLSLRCGFGPRCRSLVLDRSVAHDVQGNAGFPEPVGKVRLDAAAAAHLRLDRLEREHACIALIGGGCRSKSVGPWPGAARTGAARRRRGRQECRRPRAEKIRTRRSAPGGRAGPSASSLTGPLICQPGGRGALVRGNGLQPLILRKFARTAH